MQRVAMSRSPSVASTRAHEVSHLCRTLTGHRWVDARTPCPSTSESAGVETRELRHLCVAVIGVVCVSSISVFRTPTRRHGRLPDTSTQGIGGGVANKAGRRGWFRDAAP
eukprot:1825000-Prymnesium_polylepis.1